MRLPRSSCAAIPRNPDLNCGIRLAVSRSVPTVDPTYPGRIADSRAFSVCRNSRGTQQDHARKAKCEPPAQAEEGKIGLKNNTSRVSPAPIQHFTITWPRSVLAGYRPVRDSSTQRTEKLRISYGADARRFFPGFSKSMQTIPPWNCPRSWRCGIMSLQTSILGMPRRMLCFSRPEAIESAICG
jgi:hypothetical protein